MARAMEGAVIRASLRRVVARDAKVVVIAVAFARRSVALTMTRAVVDAGPAVRAERPGHVRPERLRGAEAVVTPSRPSEISGVVSRVEVRVCVGVVEEDCACALKKKRFGSNPRGN